MTLLTKTSVRILYELTNRSNGWKINFSNRCDTKLFATRARPWQKVDETLYWTIGPWKIRFSNAPVQFVSACALTLTVTICCSDLILYVHIFPAVWRRSLLWVNATVKWNITQFTFTFLLSFWLHVKVNYCMRREKKCNQFIPELHSCFYFLL